MQEEPEPTAPLFLMAITQTSLAHLSWARQERRHRSSCDSPLLPDQEAVPTQCEMCTDSLLGGTLTRETSVRYEFLSLEFFLAVFSF